MKFKDFNEEKLNIIEKSINEGLNVLEFAKPEVFCSLFLINKHMEVIVMKFKDFNEEKLNIIEKSINEGLNVLEFAKPELSAEELRFEYIIRVLAKHRDYTAFSIMEDIALGVCGYDFDQLKELSNAYRLKLDMNILKDVRYSGKQMKEIRIAMQKGENYNLITSYRMDHKQMHRIRMNMKEGAFTERQLEVIRKGKEEGYDISIYAKPDFSYSKMR